MREAVTVRQTDIDERDVRAQLVRGKGTGDVHRLAATTSNPSALEHRPGAAPEAIVSSIISTVGRMIGDPDGLVYLSE